MANDKKQINELLERMIRQSDEILSIPRPNFGLYGWVGEPKPDTRSRARRVWDEAAYRISGAWDCLMGRGA